MTTGICTGGDFLFGGRRPGGGDRRHGGHVGALDDLGDGAVPVLRPARRGGRHRCRPRRRRAPDDPGPRRVPRRRPGDPHRQRRPRRAPVRPGGAVRARCRADVPRPGRLPAAAAAHRSRGRRSTPGSTSAWPRAATSTASTGRPATAAPCCGRGSPRSSTASTARRWRSSATSCRWASARRSACEGGGNSLDNTLRIVDLVPTDWVLMDIRIHAVERGFGHGLVHMFAEDGTLLATASQSCIVRYWAEPTGGRGPSREARRRPGADAHHVDQRLRPVHGAGRCRDLQGHPRPPRGPPPPRPGVPPEGGARARWTSTTRTGSRTASSTSSTTSGTSPCPGPATGASSASRPRGSTPGRSTCRSRCGSCTSSRASTTSRACPPAPSPSC